MSVEVAKSIREQQEKIERDADAFIREGEELIHKHAFKEVRSALQYLNEYLTEAIEVLEERDNGC